MKNLYSRINGRGNAWPISLGQENPFYSKNNFEDLANSSSSLIKNKGTEITKESIEWEILIDAGHGAVQYLIQHQNRIPEAIVLTHPHIDHCLGVDWVAQSYYRFNNKKKYPLYATRRCWDFVVQSYPQLEQIIQFTELNPGVTIQIKEVSQLSLTSYPVYHGQSAFGSSMLLFEEQFSGKNKKVLVTGDILCPLLTTKGFEHISNASFAITDSNSRFPYPGTNHWSLMDNVPKEKLMSKYLNEWLLKTEVEDLFLPHLSKNGSEVEYKEYFENFLKECRSLTNLPLSIFEFVKKIKPKQMALVHYSGLEDARYYNQPVLNDVELQNWVDKHAKKNNIHSSFFVPKVGDVFLI